MTREDRRLEKFAILWRQAEDNAQIANRAYRSTHNRRDAADMQRSYRCYARQLRRMLRTGQRREVRPVRTSKS